MAPIITQGPFLTLQVREKVKRAKIKLMKCNLVCQNYVIHSYGYQLMYSPGDSLS